MTAPASLSTRRRVRLHPLLVMLSMLVAAMVLTHVVPAGKYAKVGTAVVPGSFQPVAKVSGFTALIAGRSPNAAETPAIAAGPVSVLAAIPAGMAKSASLMFMVMFVGGMFGVLQATGAVDAGIDRLLNLTAGNVFILTGLLMLIFASGATFLGLYSEYIAIVPLVLTICQRLKLPNLYAAAVVILGAAIGYSASITNPIVLAVAQPLARVPVFSGMPARLIIFAAMFSAGLAFMGLYVRKFPKVSATNEQAHLGARQVIVLLCVALGTAILVVGTGLWSWGTAEHAALFIAWATMLAMAGGLRAGQSADAFIDGMKMMVLPALMIGLAGAIGIILEASQVLDSVVHALAVSVDGRSPGTVAGGILIGEMALDVLVNSTSAKAAISLPILTPIAQMSGIGGNVSVSALTMAGSLTNIVTPTNGALLAFLAAAKVDYGEWARFVAPLFGVLFIIAMVAMQLMVAFEP